ncbi:hypothetical protein BC827DRAFT_1176954 [Russula dissimulans]|nr:hypothetical protein BC827DRAFT_1176954 [Russula dissimulans]
MSPSFQYDLPMRASLAATHTPKRNISHRRQAKLADVSRILDPSYLSSSTSSSPTSVYADTDGNLHDPDYRYFPVVADVPRRPAWERGGDDDDDQEEFDEQARLRNASPRERRRARYSAYEQSLPYARRSFEEVIEDRLRQSRARQKLRSRSHSPHYHETSQMVFDEPTTISPEPKQERFVPTHQEAAEWTPTCGQQFRRHWQAFTLSVRFSIFRAQRRIRRKLSA